MNDLSDPTQADAVRPHRLYMVPIANKSTAERCEVAIWALDTSAAIEAALRCVFARNGGAQLWLIQQKSGR